LFSKNQLLSGTLVAILINVFGAALVFILNIYIARSSSVEVYGNYLLIISILTIASLVSMVGQDGALSKLVPKYSALGLPSLLKGVVTFGFVIVFFSSILVALILYVSGVVAAAEIILFFFPALVFSFYFQSVFRSFKKVALSRFFDQILRPSIFIFLLFLFTFFSGKPLTLSHVVVCFSISVVSSLLVAFFAFSKAVYPRIKDLDVEFKSKEWLVFTFKMLAISLGFVFLAELDVVMVGALLDPKDVAMIGVSIKVASVSLLGLQAANVIGMPMISETFMKGDKDNMRGVVRLISRVSLLFSTSFVLIMTFFGDYVLSVFGDVFVSAYPVVMIYCVGFWVSSFFGPSGYLLVVIGKENINLLLVYAVLVLNVVISIPAIIVYGIQGAAVVTVSLLIVRNVVTWVIAKRKVGISSSAFF